MRMLSTGTLVAEPHAAALLADLGAEVIHIERPGTGDTLRALAPYVKGGGTQTSTFQADNGRNRLSMELDMHINKNTLSKEVFLKLIKSCDIWIDNLVWLEQRYGINDEMVLEANPKIVIVHVSGYGKPEFGGNANMCWRGSYDLIGQAYGGWCHLVGEPDGLPTRIVPYSIDYVSAITALIGALMGYINMLNTGKGQVVDLAQFEAAARTLGDNFTRYLNLNEAPCRTGNKSPIYQPNNIFETIHGYIAIDVSEPDEFESFLKAMAEAVGLNPDDYPWSEVNGSEEAVNSIKGRQLNRITSDWISHHARREVQALFEKYNVPSSLVYTIRDASKDQHWIDRGDFIECIDEATHKNITIFGVTPKFAQTPGRIWRGAPALGQDADDILTKILDYTPEEIQQLRAEKVICR
jgi:crotonobetainyl-CoA:carnitine CoA-transferase CaiB-like acyl-CoA transferase